MRLHRRTTAAYFTAERGEPAYAIHGDRMVGANSARDGARVEIESALLWKARRDTARNGVEAPVAARFTFSVDTPAAVAHVHSSTNSKQRHPTRHDLHVDITRRDLLNTD